MKLSKKDKPIPIRRGDSPRIRSSVTARPIRTDISSHCRLHRCTGSEDPDAPYGRHPVTGGTVFRQVEGHRWTVADLAGLLRNLWSRAPLYRKCQSRCQLLGMFFALFMSAFLIGIPFAIGIWIWAFVDGIVKTFGQCAGRCSPAIARMSREREPRKHVWGDWPLEGRTFSSPITKAITYRRRIEGKYVA